MHAYRYRLAGLTVILVCLALAVAVNAAPPNTFVTPEDVTDSSFWRIDYFDTDAPDGDEDPSAVFAESPVALAGYGISSLNMKPGNDYDNALTGCARIGGKAAFGTQELDGQPVGSITSLSYSYLVETHGFTTDFNVRDYEILAPVINIRIARSGGGETNLVYEPLYTYQAGGWTGFDLNTWYTDHVIGGTAGNGQAARWFTSGPSIPGVPDVGAPSAPNDTWEEIMALDEDGVAGGPTVGDMLIINPVPGCGQEGSDNEGTGSGLAFLVGQKSGGSWAGASFYIDAVMVETDTVAEQDVNLTLSESLTATAGTPQAQEAGFVFDTPLSVTLLDVEGSPIEGETVTFTANPSGGGASASFPNGSTATTDAQGVASVVAVANTTTGSYTVTATADGRTATFALENVAQAAFVTELVLPQDINSGDFWQVDYYDNNGAAAPSPDGSVKANPSGVVNPLTGYGDSSFQMLAGPGVDTNGETLCARTGGKVFLGTDALEGVKLKDIKTFSFAFLMEDTQNAEGFSTLEYPPYINIYVDLDGNGDWEPGVDSILVYDTVKSPNVPGPGPKAALTWYETDAIGSGSNGRWGYATSVPVPGVPSFGTLHVTPGMTWSTLTALPHNGSTIGDLKVVNPDAGCDDTASTDDEGTALGFNIQLGQKNGGSYNNSDHHVDKVNLAIDGVLAPTSFDFALHGAAAKIVKVSGDDQHATINTQFAEPLVVQITDEDDNPVQGATVQFAVLTRQASATFTPANGQAVTDENGEASIIVTANSDAGSYEVVVTVGAVFAAFDLTNDPTAAVAPTDLAATATGQTTATITWTDTATDVDTLTLYRSTDGVNFTAIGNPANTATSFDDTGLVCGTTYTYYLEVANTADTADSNTDTATTTSCTELLVNGSFELDADTNKLPDDWAAKKLTGDKLICKPAHVYDGTCAIKFKGGAGEKSLFRQVLGDISALSAGDTLYLSGAFKSSSGSSKLTITLKVKYATGPAGKIKLEFLTAQPAYLDASDSYVLTDVPTKVQVDIKNKSTGGKQYVDAVSLTLNDATRMTDTRNGEVLPPPSVPGDFRGNN